MESCTRVSRATKVVGLKLVRKMHRNLLPLASLAAPISASADYSFNFPEPVTPIARETLHIHNEFMLVITVLFVVVFAIMIYSMIKHRRVPVTRPPNSPVRPVPCNGSGH